MDQDDIVNQFLKSISKLTKIPLSSIIGYASRNNPLNILEHPSVIEMTEKQMNKINMINNLIALHGVVKELEVGKKIVLNSSEAAINFFSSLLSNKKDREIFMAAYLDNKGQLIQVEVISQGTNNACVVDKRKILEIALATHCQKVILAHNHTSGISKPSQEDRDLNQAIYNILEPLKILLEDQIIVGDQGSISLKNEGLFPKKTTAKADYTKTLCNQPKKER